jgi:hypothetical protein
MWKDGKKYQGNFINDKREGNGTFIWADGRKYVGDWKAGKQHGIGTYISKDGVSKQGEWQNGRKIRWIGEEGGAADDFQEDLN